MEQIAGLYLEALRRADAGDQGWADRYDWMVLELVDQLCRQHSGGAMQEYLEAAELPARDFIVSRLGAEARALIDRRQHESSPGAGWGDGKSRWSALRNYVRRKRRILRAPRAFVGRQLLGRDRAALDVGRFRLSGEVHQWMYDRYSLARLLRECGFMSPHRVEAAQSEIPEWSYYQLDTEADGALYKPDSLFMEAKCP
jgi:hypothetical protein